MERSRKVVNDLLTDVFNQILILEERNLTEHDAVDVTMTENQPQWGQFLNV